MRLVTALYFRLFEPFLMFGVEARRQTTMALRSARIRMFPEWYLTLSYCVSTSTAALVLLLLMAAGFARGAGWPGVVVACAVAGASFALVRLGFLTYPRLRATSRARQIDAEFPHVSILFYALSRGGVQPLELFRTVHEERNVFGEVSVECGLVVREVEWLGNDLITALEQVASTTPSPTFKAYLEGLVTILNSGADPRDYLRRQAETQLQQGEMRMQRDLDQAAMLAEVYVSGLLVLPLLLIVILSVLSSLGDGQGSYIPAIVFGLLPVGTASYLLLVEMLLPPDPLGTPPQRPSPVSDFGMEVVHARDLVLPPPRPLTLAEYRAEEASSDAQRLRRRLAVEWGRQRAREAWTTFVARAVTKPLDAIEVSGSVGLLALVIGMGAAWLGGSRGRDLLVDATSVFLLAGVLAALPVAVFHEIRLRRARHVAAALPETIGRLSSFNERGIGIVQSFRILADNARGPLAKDLRAFTRDMQWTPSLGSALRRLQGRVGTLTMTRLTTLFARASETTGDLKEVLDIAARDTARSEALRARRQQAMASYVVVIYVVFAVFLYVLYMIANLFYGAGGLSAASSGVSAKGLDAGEAQVLFYHAALIQGLCCGFVAGKLGEGHLLSGIKHAAILVTIAWAVFTIGVLG